MALKLSSLVIVVMQYGLVSCAAIKPYEKEYLIHPLMEDDTIARLEGIYTTKTKPLERLASSGAGAASTSCPTCGGK